MATALALETFKIKVTFLGMMRAFLDGFQFLTTYWESVTVKESEVEMSISVGVGSPLLVVVAILVD